MHLAASAGTSRLPPCVIHMSLPRVRIERNKRELKAKSNLETMTTSNYSKNLQNAGLAGGNQRKQLFGV